MIYEEMFDEWFDKYEAMDLSFKDLKNKFHEAQQVSAIIFLASKLKDKNERYFLHGEHDVLYIGSDYDVFEEFTEEDIKIAVYHGIYRDEESGGFQIYASI